MEYTLSHIARLLNGTLSGDGTKIINGAAGFEDAGPDDITYAGNPKFLGRIAETPAGAVLVPNGVQCPGKNIIEVENPRIAFNDIVIRFDTRTRPTPGIHENAHIGEGFTPGSDLHVGPFVSIGNHVKVGDRVVLHAHVVLQDHTVLGDDVEIHPHVTIMHGCRIGNRVMIHPGTVVGSDGFGFEPVGERYEKIIHTGIVRIDDDVEIGACNTIDRGTIGKTWIKRGVKTDNLIQIGHNVVVGEDTIIVAQVGISGSASIGRHVVMAGQAGIGGHITIGDNAVIGPQAGIIKSVADGDILSGTPAMPHKNWLRSHRVLPSLPELKKRIAALEKRLADLAGE
ncbi:MAG: UDP-3-O-(3-hydroxymyristoyl)glucosamine N-acyltransferase [Desulfobacterales bacterium]